MNELHEANRRGWDAVAAQWQAGLEHSQPWRQMVHDPTLYFEPEQLQAIGSVAGKRICVLGSGNNFAVFALAGMGAQLTSVDISQAQLDIAARRAAEIGLNIRFMRADVTDLSELADASFDMVYTGGHVAVWVSDLNRYYAEAARILVPKGRLVICEYHPFRRLWEDGIEPYRLKYPYFDLGPHTYDRAEDTPELESGPLISHEFHWTVADYVHALWHAGLNLTIFEEFGEAPQDWEPYPSRGLPENLLLVGVKTGDCCNP